MDDQSTTYFDSATPTLRILRTVPPTSGESDVIERLREQLTEGAVKLAADTNVTVKGFPAGFTLPHSARTVRANGISIANGIEGMLRHPDVANDLTPGDVQQISALTHALDVALGTIAGRITSDAARAAEPEPADVEDQAVERAVRAALGAAWDAFAGEIGALGGNPMHWHPEASALAAVMTDAARGWLEAVKVCPPGHRPVSAVGKTGPEVSAS